MNEQRVYELLAEGHWPEHIRALTGYRHGEIDRLTKRFVRQEIESMKPETRELVENMLREAGPTILHVAKKAGLLPDTVARISREIRK